MLKGLRQPTTGTAPPPKTLAKTSSQSFKRAPDWNVERVEEQMHGKARQTSLRKSAAVGASTTSLKKQGGILQNRVRASLAEGQDPLERSAQRKNEVRTATIEEAPREQLTLPEIVPKRAAPKRAKVV